MGKTDHSINQPDSLNVANTKWEDVNSQQCLVIGQETMGTDKNTRAKEKLKNKFFLVSIFKMGLANLRVH